MTEEFAMTHYAFNFIVYLATGPKFRQLVVDRIFHCACTEKSMRRRQQNRQQHTASDFVTQSMVSKISKTKDSHRKQVPSESPQLLEPLATNAKEA